MLSPSKLHQLQRIAKQALSKSSFEPRRRVGAVLFKNGKILAKGCNMSTKTSALARKYFRFATVHAEVAAVLQVIYHEQLLQGADIFVYRELANGSPALAKPCAMCVSVLAEVGVKRAYWSTDQYPFFDSAKITVLKESLGEFSQVYETNNIQKRGSP